MATFGRTLQGPPSSIHRPCQLAAFFISTFHKPERECNGPEPSRARYRKTPRLSILVLGNFLGGGTEMLTFERS